MAGTLNIPLTTLTVGEHDFGPAAVADADTVALLSIDRTVVNGFGSQPVTTQATYEIDQSNDGGNTWVLVVGGTMTGGPAPGTHSTAKAGFAPGTGRQARAKVVVSGASVAVAGTLTIT